MLIVFDNFNFFMSTKHSYSTKIYMAMEIWCVAECDALNTTVQHFLDVFPMPASVILFIPTQYVILIFLVDAAWQTSILQSNI